MSRSDSIERLERIDGPRIWAFSIAWSVAMLSIVLFGGGG